MDYCICCGGYVIEGEWICINCIIKNIKSRKENFYGHICLG